MMPVTTATLALAVVGLIVWGYGYRVDDAAIRWVAIGCLATAFLLRFVPGRR